MWFKCAICHKTYSHKANLKRHLDGTHMQKSHRCNLCTKEFKRRDYLTRHLRQAHKTSSNSVTFQQIADCVTTDQSPQAHYPPALTHLDEMDDFLDSLDDSTTTATQSSTSLGTSSQAPPSTSTSIISVCTQTDLCSLPPLRNPRHIGINTTPTFYKDKCTQQGGLLVDAGHSPHIKMVSPDKGIQGWDSPLFSPPKTPGWDIPSYYTTEYQLERVNNNLPESIPYQGPMMEEDPLPPHLTQELPQWGVIRKNTPPPFLLMDYLEDICESITPPGL